LSDRSSDNLAARIARMCRRLALAAVIVCGITLGWAAPAAQAPAPTITNRALQAALDEWLAQTQYPGAALGVASGSGSAGFVSGVAGVNDLMLAGSTGKTFFAAVAVQLIDAGALDLDAPISRYLGNRPWF